MITRALVLTTALLAVASACGDGDGPAPRTATPSPAATTSSASPTTAPSPGWRQLASMPTPRTEVAAAELNGQIYVIGGFLVDGTASDKVEVYDPPSDSWFVVAALPETRHHAAAVAMDGVLYVIGGYRTTFGDATDTVFAYDPIANSWTQRERMPTARGALAVAASGGLIYAIGGARTGPGGSTESIADVAAYDPEADSWSVVSAMATARDHLAAAAAAPGVSDPAPGAIFAIGGRAGGDFGRNLAANEAYLPVRDTWSSGLMLPTARSGIAAATLHGRIYVFGGEGAGGTFDDNEVYDMKANRWSFAPRMPTARHGLGAAVVGDTMYVIGGGPTPGLSVSGANEAFTP